MTLARDSNTLGPGPHHVPGTWHRGRHTLTVTASERHPGHLRYMLDARAWDTGSEADGMRAWRAWGEVRHGS